MVVQTAVAAALDENLVKDLVFTSSTANLDGTKMSATFTLTADATVSGSILDGSNVLKTLSASDFNCVSPCSAGTVTVSWDGSKNDAASYNLLGTYTLSVKAETTTSEDIDTLDGAKVTLSFVSNTSLSSTTWNLSTS